MSKASVFSAILITIALALGHSGTRRPSMSLSPQATVLQLYEAEILVYLLPQAHEIRKEGFDVVWTLEDDSKTNQRDFYTFWVISTRKQVEGSRTIGYFSVNKHTADIVDPLQNIITSPELEGIQRILRKAHGVDEATLQEFRSRRPD